MGPKRNASNTLPIVSLVAFSLAVSSLLGTCVWVSFTATTEFDGLILVPVSLLTVPVIAVSIIISACTAIRRRWVRIPLLLVQIPALLILIFVFYNS
jgi:hypothetical protein